MISTYNGRSRRALVALALAAALIGGAVASGPMADAAAPPSEQVSGEHLPPATNFLFWPAQLRPAGFRNMAKLFVAEPVAKGSRVRPLPAGRPLSIRYREADKVKTVEDYMSDNFTGGLLVLSEGKIVLERYGLGLDEDHVWTSMSVGKSFTSTLVGAAIKDGAIGGVNDPITKYVPELRGTAWEGVTLRNALTMSTGIAYNEDYRHGGDGMRIVGPQVPGEAHTQGMDLVAFMARSPREAAPGSQFNYASGVARLLGVVVANATHRKLNEYLSEKVWVPAGMEHEATWIKDGSGRIMSSGFLNATLRDFARFGLFFMQGARENGQSVLPEGWMAEATSPLVASDDPKVRYGYQWWVYPDGTYRAIGVFGQMIYVNPKRDRVVVTLSAWPSAEWKPGYARQQKLIDAIGRALDPPR